MHLAERRLADAATRGPREAGDARPSADVRWRFVRAHALRRLGRCAEAIVDYELARPFAGAAGADADLERATCEMSLGRWAAARRTLESMARTDEQRWEAWYNLGVVRALLGDLDGARAAQRRLEALRPERADALRVDHIDPLAARRAAPADVGHPAPAATPVPVLTPTPAMAVCAAQAATAAADAANVVGTGGGTAPGTAPGTAAVPCLLGAGAITIGDRSLVLSDASWVLASARRFGVPGKAQFRIPPLPFDTPAIEAVAYGPAGERGATLIAFAANPRAGDGVVAWDVEPCRVRDAIHVERFAGRFDTPECLVVRRVASDASEPLTRFGPAFAAMRAGETAPAASYYEIRYSCYWVAWFGDVTVLLPLPSVPGDFVAIQWGRRLADAVRPLARSTLRTAVVPPP